MPTKDGDTPRRKSRKDEDSPRVRAKDSSEKDKLRRRYRRQSSPESLRPATARPASPDGKRLYRSSVADMSSRLKAVVGENVPEMSRRASVGETRMSAYPTFSKEHSREAVRPQEETASQSRVSPVAQEPSSKTRTEYGKSDETLRPGAGPRHPPSPPLTSDERDLPRPNSGSGSRRSHETTKGHAERTGADGGQRQPPPTNLRSEVGTDHRAATSSGERKRPDSASRVRKDPRISPRSSMYSSQPGSPIKDRDHARAIPPVDTRVDSHMDSKPSSRIKETTSTAPPSQRQAFDHQADQATPTQSTTTAAERFRHNNIPFRSFSQPVPLSPPQASPPKWQAGFTSIPPVTAVPPPPPPPPQVDLPSEPPHVDYLLKNGGLPQVVSKSLLNRTQNNKAPLSQIPDQLPGVADANAMFSPIVRRIADFNRVLEKSGSVAVATGYRSVARKLLDRLEHVFARNISSEKCLCVMCHISTTSSQVSADEETGVSWGEILEFVSGRRELPQWPPFSLDNINGAGMATDNIDNPMQNLDPDVPEELRQHYMRQNDKTKRSVQNWLQGQTVREAPSGLPTDVDDETLSFAMLTRLDSDQRAVFGALIRGATSLPVSRSATAAGQIDGVGIAVLDRTGLALQRLYRLNARPRKPECTIYLLTNPQLHGMLATLAAVSPAEWDILVSGRFDGFLWTGTEGPAYGAQTGVEFNRSSHRGQPGVFSSISTPFSSNNNPSFSPSRNQTLSPAFSIPRGQTPMSATTQQPPAGAAPVQHDEETEIAALFELERTIYRDMELLENVFESVHQSAETLRTRLRSRAAGLSMAAQARRGSMASEDEGMRMNTPGTTAWGVESVFDDGRSELAPDDSASMIGINRRRRGKERRTPGMDDGGIGAGTAAYKRRYR